MKAFFKRNSVSLFFIFYIVYCEIIYKLFSNTFSLENLIYPVLFAVITGAFIGTLCALCPKFLGKLLSIIFLIITMLPFMVQIVYTNWFKTAVTLESAFMGAGNMMNNFADMAIAATMEKIVPVILFIIPAILYLVFIRKFTFNRIGIKNLCMRVGVIVIMLVCTVSSMLLWGTESYSYFDLYKNVSSLDTAIAKLGVTTSTRLDLKRIIFGSNIELSIVENSEVPVIENKPVEPSQTVTVYEPNQLNINFDELISNETDHNVLGLHNYFSQVLPTYKNEYTGMFEGYNLIMLTCEAFSPMAISEEYTPTLYKLKNNGFVFNNFYTPIWGVSTSDGEYVACTGNYPKAGVWSFSRSYDNDMIYCLGNVFKEQGYKTLAYHNHDYTYYDRNKSHPNMGYEFKGVGNGLDITNQWPESDLEMIKQSISSFINEDKFHVYYMTVSGHLEYNFFGNAMANKNKELVENLDMSDACKAYIACHIELDKAVEYLINALEDTGKLDSTVIVMSADHYPYGLTNEEIQEFLGHYPEQNFELYKNSFIVYNSAMKENIIVDKYASSIDILPTVLNLFGVEYDSRLLAGRDILSNSEPLVAFNNGSFITDKCMYNTQTSEIINFTDNEISDEYIENISNLVVNKFNASALVLDTNYYSYVKGVN